VLPPIDPLLGSVSRLVVSLLFAAAAIDKLRNRPMFLAVLREYRLLPAPLVAPAAVAVVCAELFAAAGIWWPGLRTVAAAVAAGLLVAYAAAIGINLLRGRREIDCGCTFGQARQMLSPALLVRNALLLLPCAAAAMPLAGPVDWAVGGTSLFAAAVFALCYQLFGVLLANRPRALRLRGQ
jgi:hypothetical protein